MGWTVTYELRRDAPLTEEERERLVRHAVAGAERAWACEPYRLDVLAEPRDGLVAAGDQKVPREALDHPDFAHLFRLLDELRGLVPGATLEVRDDFEIIGWDRVAGRYGFVGPEDDEAPSKPLEGGALGLRVEPFEGPITIDASSVRAALRETDMDDEISLTGRLRSSWLPADQEYLFLVLRDEAGRIVEVLDRSLPGPYTPVQRFLEKLSTTGRVLKGCPSFDIVIRGRRRVESPILAGYILPPVLTHQRQEWSLGALRPTGAVAGVEVTARAFTRLNNRGDEARIQAYVELTLPREAVGGETRVELKLTARDGTEIASTGGDAWTDAKGRAVAVCTTTAPIERLSAARRAAIHLRGDLYVSATVATCRIVGRPEPAPAGAMRPIF